MAEPHIHPTAVVEDGATLGEGVRIGPFCHVGPLVTLAEDVELKAQCSVQGRTTIGARSRVFPFAAIGGEPQDLKFAGEDTTLTIGSDCTLREGVTINPGTAGDRSETVVGDRCTLLANAHVAHDCTVGDGCIFSNNVMLAGHCTVGDNVIFGGGSAIHQFARIGRNAFIGGLAGVEGDLIPFGLAVGNRAHLAGLNLIGLKRAGVAREEIHALRAAHKALFDRAAPVQQNAARLREAGQPTLVMEVLDFILERADRALCTPANG